MGPNPMLGALIKTESRYIGEKTMEAEVAVMHLRSQVRLMIARAHQKLEEQGGVLPEPLQAAGPDKLLFFFSLNLLGCLWLT